MVGTTWSLREVDMRTTTHRSLEEYRRMEFPHESVGWLYRASVAPPQGRRRSVFRTILGWVGFGKHASAD